MNFILGIPIEVRLLVLFVVGGMAGSLANLAIYQLAMARRPFSPWSRGGPHAPKRRFLDYVPIAGWLSLRRESSIHGPGHWVRPMLLELVAGIGLAALYWWEVQKLAIWPAGVLPPPGGPPLAVIAHLEFVSLGLLAALMLVATFIDIDETIIPDTVTIPGTAAGLILAAMFPSSLPPDWYLPPNAIPGNLQGPAFVLDFLKLTSPNPWPAGLDGFPRGGPLILGLGCYGLWCVGLLPRPWRTRHGYRRAWQILMARIAKEGFSRFVLALALLGSAGIGISWYVGGTSWQALLTALVGMAIGGGLIWLVRIVGTAALKREAMGFGDVTLMAMIGAFLGWQPCLMIFFLAPFAGLVVGVVQWFINRGHEIPYGPFLCLATLGVMVYWAPVWAWGAGIFSLGWFLGVVMLVCLILMAVLLGIWRFVREALLNGR